MQCLCAFFVRRFISAHLLQLLGSTIQRYSAWGKGSEDGHEIIPVPANHIMSQQLSDMRSHGDVCSFRREAVPDSQALTEIEDSWP
jgi:hypothetical protein